VSTNFSNQDFRKAMGQFATGICVMGAKRADGALIGMTVNSFSSVSLNPPLILVCLGTYAPRTNAIIEAKTFSISVLSAQQEHVSQHFAKPGEGLIPQKGCRVATNGAPVVEDALATLECELEVTHLAGDHQIVIGRVMKLKTNPDPQPLLYFQGHYQSLDQSIS